MNEVDPVEGDWQLEELQSSCGELNNESCGAQADLIPLDGYCADLPAGLKSPPDVGEVGLGIVVIDDGKGCCRVYADLVEGARHLPIWETVLLHTCITDQGGVAGTGWKGARACARHLGCCRRLM